MDRITEHLILWVVGWLVAQPREEQPDVTIDSRASGATIRVSLPAPDSPGMPVWSLELRTVPGEETVIAALSHGVHSPRTVCRGLTVADATRLVHRLTVSPLDVYTELTGQTLDVRGEAR